MTMKPILINAGNRTGDRLHIACLDKDGSIDLSTHMRIHRGQQADISKFLDRFDVENPINIRIWCGTAKEANPTYAPEDEYKDHPSILIADQPENI